MAEQLSPLLIKQAERFPGTAVFGAGVVGLAIAENIARRGRPVVVFEAAPKEGTETSSHNSEVIHSGFYYPQGSNKARLCVTGREMLYRYSRSRGVNHRRTGKLVVATSNAELKQLSSIEQKAISNGVDDIAWLTAEQVYEMEPAVKSVAAIHSPSTGIVDSEGLMRKLRSDIERNGGDVVFNSPVTQGEVLADGIILMVGGDIFKFDAVVNSAGFSAQKIAGLIEGVPATTIPETAYAKGYYYSLEGKPPFTHLVYPVPVPGGLGTHATIDLGGSVRFGPNVEWVDTPDYSFVEDLERKKQFVTAIKRYYPTLNTDALHVVATGIRPKTGRAAEQDFIIQGVTDHGVKGYIGLYGIESPGLTSALAIGRVVGDMLISPGLTAAQAAENLVIEMGVGT